MMQKISGLVLFLMIQYSASWSSGIHNLGVCTSFHVSHIHNNAMALPECSVNITMKMKGATKYCMKPNTYYEIKFDTQVDGKMNKYEMKGILFKLNTPNVMIDKRLPNNTKKGICGPNSITHSCDCDPGSSPSYCKANNCKIGNGTNLTITVKTAALQENLPKSIQFRYTIVLSAENKTGNYIQNKTVAFPLPPCPPQIECSSEEKKPPKLIISCNTSLLEQHETNMPIEYCPDFELKEGANKWDKTCGKLSSWSNVTHIYTDPHTKLNYSCHTKPLVRETECKPSCLGDDDRQWCCKNSIRAVRNRNFMCTATPELNYGNIPSDCEKIHYSADVLQTKKCECYLCSKINCTNSKCNRINH